MLKNLVRAEVVPFYPFSLTRLFDYLKKYPQAYGINSDEYESSTDFTSSKYVKQMHIIWPLSHKPQMMCRQDGAML